MSILERELLDLPPEPIADRRGVAALHRGPGHFRHAARFSLIGADVVAGAAVALIHRAWTVPVAILVLAIIALNSAGGYYRYRLTLSILDDLPQLLGHVLVGIGVAMMSASVIAPTEGHSNARVVVSLNGVRRRS